MSKDGRQKTIWVIIKILKAYAWQINMLIINTRMKKGKRAHLFTDLAKKKSPAEKVIIDEILETCILAVWSAFLH